MANLSLVRAPLKWIRGHLAHQSRRPGPDAYDAPERILVSTIDLRPDWSKWNASSPTEVLASQENYECPNLPVIPSHAGDAEKPVHELRDPGIYVEKDRVFLLYSICGEQGLAAAELNIPRATKK